MTATSAVVFRPGIRIFASSCRVTIVADCELHPIVCLCMTFRFQVGKVVWKILALAGVSTAIGFNDENDSAEHESRHRNAAGQSANYPHTS